MDHLGIVDEEEIIRRKREKDIFLKDKFNLESFEKKYEREIRLREEKKRRMFEQKLREEKEFCTFQPDIKGQNGHNRSVSKSPTQTAKELQASKSSAQTLRK